MFINRLQATCTAKCAFFFRYVTAYLQPRQEMIMQYHLGHLPHETIIHEMQKKMLNKYHKTTIWYVLRYNLSPTSKQRCNIVIRFSPARVFHSLLGPCHSRSGIHPSPASTKKTGATATGLISG